MVKAQKAKTKKIGSMKTASATTKPQRSDNPMDWLYDNPLGSFPDFTFGILKHSYQGHRNKASEFAIRKLMPASSDNLDPATFDVSGITAFRYGVILPPGAPDYLDTAEYALKMLDVAALPHQPSRPTTRPIRRLAADRTRTPRYRANLDRRGTSVLRRKSRG